ncbi:hypothetical protein ILYODFUR_026600 [Ilyodon furcidens]|uniref:Uncharacterized protein n=1 Tax=Ilyodon furcidens TaxID=33524 RepID=A0ABV0T0F0_9TELE
MAYSRLLLLLLIGATVPHLLQVHARPADFWCDTNTRLSLMLNFKDEGNCPDVLPSPFLVPCVGLNLLEWENKTLQEKKAEVLENFQVFQDGIWHVGNQSNLECQAWVETFKHNVLQFVKIVSRVHKQNDGSTPPRTPTQKCGEKNKLSEVLKIYRKLTRGKLEYLAIDIRETDCIHNRKRSLRQEDVSW